MPSSIARIFFAVALLAFGIQHLVYREFVTRVIPKLPAWIPWHSVWACLAGITLIVVGAAILMSKRSREAATLLGGFVLLSVSVFYVPLLATSPPLGGIWTNAGKALALSGGAFLVAGSLQPSDHSGRLGLILHSLERLIPAGRFFVGAFFALAGVQHFLFAGFVSTLVPAWIPGHLFWTYFAGVALIAGGLGMMISMTARKAAFWSGTMIFLWVLLLHIPRALAAPRDSNETTAVFEALAVSAAAFLAANRAEKIVMDNNFAQQ